MTISNLIKMAEILQKGRNHCGKGETAVPSNFSFSLAVYKRLVLQKIINKGLFGKRVESIPNKPWFSPSRRGLLKPLQEIENGLVTSISSFSHNVLYNIENKSK